VDAARAADPATAVRAMAVTSRCLLLIERDPRRAVQLAEEAQTIAQRHDLAPAELPWALGMAHYHLGEADRAYAELRTAVERNHAADDHWGHCMCLQQLACIALERREADEALTWCADLDNFAAKLGEGSERPFGRALAALSRRLAGRVSWPEVDAALDGLKRLDAKGLYAYALNCAAEIALEQSQPLQARAYARGALDAAEAVERKSERVVANMLLGGLELDAGDRGGARSRYEAVLGDLADPFTVSHRAQAHAAKLAARLGLPPIPRKEP
jgi:hypothetical protein